MKLAAIIRGAIEKIVGRSYDGAANGRRWRGAGEMPRPLSAINAARGPISRRARYLCGNNALAASGAEAWVSALVGSGIKPQSAHPSPDVRTTLNSAFERWTDASDADEQADFYGQQAMAARRMVIDGDVFGILSITGATGIPLRLRLIDCDQVDPQLHHSLSGGGQIVSGIELDATGRRTAYHIFRDRPGSPFASSLGVTRLPSSDVVHLFNPLMPGQIRGLSWFAPILLRLHDLDEAHDAQLVRQKVAALLAGFIIDQNGDLGGFAGQASASEPSVLEGGLEPGTLKVLSPGKDIKFSEPASVGAEVIDFLRITAREIAAGLGVPYETLTGDLSSVNYSSIRAGLVAFRRRVEALQYNLLVFQFCRPIWRRFVTTAVLSGQIDLPGFAKDPEAFMAVRWIPPKTDWVDPQKDVNAEIAAIEAGLMSRRQAVAARGFDLEELDQEISDDRRRAEALRLTFGGSGPPQAESIEELPDNHPREAAA